MLRLIAYWDFRSSVGYTVCCAGCAPKAPLSVDLLRPIMNPPATTYEPQCSICRKPGILDNPTVNECSTS